MEEYKEQLRKQVTLDKKMTFAQWADSWYADYESQVQPSTYSLYKYTLNILKKHLGKNILCEIKPIHINRFMDKLVVADYSLSQIQKCRAMLIQIFDAADSNGLVVINAARKAKVIRDLDGSLSAPRIDKDAFSEEEIERMEAGLPDTLLGNSIRLILNTGLRVQELLALTPEDIAPDGSLVTVTKAIKTVDGQPELGPPKSKRGKRTIPVPAHARPYALAVRNGGGRKMIWVRQGKTPYYSVGTYRKQYYAALEQLPGVRRLSPHCCRHTYITMLQARGVSIETVARLAGHSSIETTDHYTHISNDTLADAVCALERKDDHHVA